MNWRKETRFLTPPGRPLGEAIVTFWGSSLRSRKKSTTPSSYVTPYLSSSLADSHLGIDPPGDGRCWHPKLGSLAKCPSGASCRCSRRCTPSIFTTRPVTQITNITCTQIREQYPWLERYDNDWPTTTIMKQYLRNNRNSFRRKACDAAVNAATNATANATTNAAAATTT